MPSRLVLDCGSFGHALVEQLGERYAPDELLVIVDAPSRVETLRSENIPARTGDPTDPTVIESLVAAHADPTPPGTVVVAGNTAENNRRAARAARAAFPDAALIAYVGAGTDVVADAAARAELAAVADEVIDPGRTIARRVLAAAGQDGLRVRTLQRVLRDLDTLAVLTHDNPDPDAIASAAALASLAERAGCAAEIRYAGEIAHQENRALVNLLGFDLRRIETDAADLLTEYDGIALVDHSRPGVNDPLPDDAAVDIVIDHHPPRGPVDARFVDLRSDVGATSTLLVDHLRRLNVDPDWTIATGLLYGIRVDTKDFRREVSVEDFEAAAYLAPRVDHDTLARVESPSMSADTLDTIGRAIHNREVRDTALVSCVGTIRDRDALAQAADRLLDMEDVQATLVAGFQDGTIYVSARARGAGIDVGEILRDAFGQIGDAGGHADMAGAQIPMGLLGRLDLDETDTSELTAVVAAVVADRFFETLGADALPDPQSSAEVQSPSPPSSAPSSSDAGYTSEDSSTSTATLADDADGTAGDADSGADRTADGAPASESAQNSDPDGASGTTDRTDADADADAESPDGAVTPDDG